MPFMEAYEPREKRLPLTGPIKRRADARVIYGEIVSELQGCDDRDTLEIYLMTIGEQLLQFETELDFYWSGDGADFIGLDAEIKRAWAKFDW